MAFYDLSKTERQKLVDEINYAVRTQTGLGGTTVDEKGCLKFTMEHRRMKT